MTHHHRNPWGPKSAYRKRVITVSVTEEQDTAFEQMKADLGLTSDGDVIKKGLSLLHDTTYGAAGP